MPTSENAKLINLYFGVKEEKPLLSSEEIKILITELRGLFEEVKFDRLSFTKYMEKHPKLSEVMDKW